MQKPGGVRRTGGVGACLTAALVLVGLSAPSVHALDGFEIAGEIDGLYPGAEATLDARVSNPHPFGILVTSTTVTVLDASPACGASALEIGGLQAAFVVPPGGTGSVPLQVRMRLDAPDACQGATWPLAFVGTAIGTPTSGLPGTNMIDPHSPAALLAIGAALLTATLVAAWRTRWPRRGSAS